MGKVFFKRRKINSALQIVLGFLVVILLGTFLLCLPISSNNHKWFSFIDSFLAATSAVCVTGLTAVDVAVQFSLFGQIVLMLLIQIGGLGFITLTCFVYLLIGKKISYKERKTLQDSLNQNSAQGIVKLLKQILILVFVAEFLGFACLLPSMVKAYGWGNGIFKALFLSISAFCNAGFDCFGTSETPFASLSGFAQNPFVLLPVMLLVVVGGIGFIVLFDLGGIFKRKKMSVHSKVTLIVTAILIFGGALIFGLLEWNNPATLGNMSVGGKILNSLFFSVSPRTAGFSTVNYAGMTSGGIVLTCIWMVIGGGSVSTAGGIKITTFVCILLAIFKSANDKGDITIGKKKVSNQTILKSVKVVGYALILVTISTFAICWAEGGAISFEQSVFETISAISTSGLSMGITVGLGVFSKLVLIVLMFIGRVGAITLTLAMINMVSDAKGEIEYPDSKIIVG